MGGKTKDHGIFVPVAENRLVRALASTKERRPDVGTVLSREPQCLEVGSWHKDDLRLAAPEGLLTGALPTCERECRFTAGNQTQFRAAANAHK